MAMQCHDKSHSRLDLSLVPDMHRRKRVLRTDVKRRLHPHAPGNLYTTSVAALHAATPSDDLCRHKKRMAPRTRLHPSRRHASNGWGHVVRLPTTSQQHLSYLPFLNLSLFLK